MEECIGEFGGYASCGREATVEVKSGSGKQGVTKVLMALVSYVGGFEHPNSGVCSERSLAEGAMVVGVREAGFELGDGVREVGCALGEVEQSPVLWIGDGGDV